MTGCPAGHRPAPGPQAHAEARTPLYGPEFAADPAAVYARLRHRFGPAAPVELADGVPAVLVLDYQLALAVLRSPDTFSKDPRAWQATVPAQCPVLPMMMYRPNALHADGDAHTRLRGALTDSLSRVHDSRVRRFVQRAALELISEFQTIGRADLLSQYATRLPLLVFEQMFGCPPDVGAQMRAAMAAIFDGRDAERANADLGRALLGLIDLKRARPGADVTTALITHRSRLTNEELVHQLVLLLGAGTEPVTNFIANTLLHRLSDEHFADDVTGGTVSVSDGMDEVSYNNPPISNFAITYAVYDVRLGGLFVPPRIMPIVISIAAANTDPALTEARRTGNRAHLAFSAGPHACPARRQGQLIAAVAIETILDALPDVELAVPADQLHWRPGPFHRALTSLPVTFPPTTAPAVIDDTRGATPWTPQPNLLRSPSTPPAVTSTAKPLGSAPAGPPRSSNSRAGSWSGR